MRQKTVLACIVIVAAFLAMVVLSLETPPHAFKNCASCHVFTNPSGETARDLTQPITLLCTTCHEKTLTEGYMHPINVRPEHVNIPADMPLSRYGQLVCTTCHDVHAEYFTPYGVPTHFLRRQESGKAFCRICHENLNALGQGHQAQLGEAHFRSQYIMTDPSRELDPMSMNCVSCHDGAFATSVSIRSGIWRHSKGFLQYDQGNHPVGVRYEDMRTHRGRKTDLKPIFEVDRRIRFFKGKVGCGSCHDPYSTLHKKLVMTDEHSKLCLACHKV